MQTSQVNFTTVAYAKSDWQGWGEGNRVNYGQLVNKELNA